MVILVTGPRPGFTSDSSCTHAASIKSWEKNVHSRNIVKACLLFKQRLLLNFKLDMLDTRVVHA